MTLFLRPLILASVAGLAACGSAGLDDSVERWISGLSSDDPGTRERAEEDLRRVGPRAEGALHRAEQSPKRETRQAAGRLLGILEWNRRPPLVCLSPASRPRRILKVPGAALFEVPGAGVLGGLRWSPDGTRLAFTRSGTGVMTIAADGGPAEVLTPLPALDARSCSWSPDGIRFLFVSTHLRSPGGGVQPGTFEHVYSVRRTTGEAVKLTAGDANHFDPCWSPDGRRVVYVAGTQRFEVCIVPAAGGAAETVTSDGRMKTGLAWSPDGGEIVFTLGDEDGALASLDLATRRVRKLSSAGGREAHPVFSPDGTRLAFLRGRDGSEDRDLWVRDRRSGAERPLAAGPGPKGRPAWSPDGSRLAFSWAASDGPPAIYVVHSDGTGLAPVARPDAGATDPAWAPFR